MDSVLTVTSIYFSSALKIFLACIIATTTIFVTALPALAEDTYTPIYDKGWVVTYRDLSGAWTEETRRGFNQFFDPYDPVLICQTIDEDACTVPPSLEAFSMVLASEPSYPESDLEYDFFKIYIPPGTIQVDFVSFPAQADQIGYALRFRAPPSGDYDPLGPYASYDWSVNTPKDIRSFEDRDVLINNSGGNIQVMGSGDFPEVENGGWLYVRVLRFEPGVKIYKFRVKKRFKTATYVEWFRNAEFDAAGNPTGGIDPGLGMDDLDEDGNGRIEMNDAVLKLQKGAPQTEIDAILEILTGH